MNISNFMSWWWSELTIMFSQILNKLNAIQLASGVTLLSFIMGIVIIKIVIDIVIASPKVGNSIVSKKEIKKGKKN